MKLLSKTMLGMLLSFSVSAACAQQSNTNRRLFDAYPQTVKLDNSVFNTALDYAEGTNVSLSLSDNFHFDGTVISNQKKYGNIHTVIIRNSDNSILQVTGILNNDKTVSYGGRIMNQNAADGYQIKSTNGVYALQKFETDKIFQPCNL